MKTKKLLKRVGAVLEGAEAHEKVDRSALEKLLRRLGEKEAELAGRLAGERDADKAAKLTRKIHLLRAQRSKGEHTLSALD
ncbi:MAG: hypothetical protein P1P84_13010 [Deferrisomatales bacterium]|nr:hypothetical protein [Deferrisomatales bacterium]